MGATAIPLLHSDVQDIRLHDVFCFPRHPFTWCLLCCKNVAKDRYNQSTVDCSLFVSLCFAHFSFKIKNFTHYWLLACCTPFKINFSFLFLFSDKLFFCGLRLNWISNIFVHALWHKLFKIATKKRTCHLPQEMTRLLNLR